MVAQLVFWVLAAIMFYTVAIWPSLQFAAFTDNTTVHIGFVVACGILLFAFWLLEDWKYAEKTFKLYNFLE